MKLQSFILKKTANARDIHLEISGNHLDGCINYFNTLTAVRLLQGEEACSSGCSFYWFLERSIEKECCYKFPPLILTDNF